MKNTKKGFTLIELLVVIAIIGILASVVLASLNSARSKGSDASVKANMAGIAAQAELYYDPNGTYGNSAVCTVGSETGVFSDTNIKAAISQVITQLASPASVTCTTAANGQKWAVSADALKSAGGTWCVDSSGWRKPGTSAAGICS